MLSLSHRWIIGKSPSQMESKMRDKKIALWCLWDFNNKYRGAGHQDWAASIGAFRIYVVSLTQQCVLRSRNLKKVVVCAS